MTVGDRQHRIVWRVRSEGGDTVVEIAEVWAVGWRENAAVYAEVERRLEQLGDHPKAIPLAEVIAVLGRHVGRIESTVESPTDDPIPAWIRNGLLSAGVPRGHIDLMTGKSALAELQAPLE